MVSAQIHRTISQQLVELLRMDILSGKVRPGEPLREEKVAKQYSVSRGPVREALVRLCHEGLLVSEPNVGVRVASTPDSAMRSLIIQTRLNIEKFAVARMIDHPDEEYLARLESALANLRTACEQGSVEMLRRFDLEFHRTIIEANGDKELLALWQPFVSRMMLHYDRLKDLMESYEEHLAIFRAVAARDLEAAVAALEVNLRY